MIRYIRPVRKGKVRISVYDPVIGAAERARVRAVVRSGWISSLGPAVRDFEARVAAFLGVPHAVAAMNGTAAMHLALAAVGIGPGDEVIVPDLTFVATASAVRHAGAVPVPADVLAETWQIDPADAARRRTPRTRAVVAVHLYGNPADVDALSSALPGLDVVEDAAEAFGARWKGRPVGSLGRSAAFSFYGNKIITTGEGGMVTTHEESVAARVRRLRDHAMDPVRRYWHEEVGYNYRMTALQAAVGLGQMDRIDEILRKKRAIAAAYAERLRGLPGVVLHPVPPGCEGVFWMYSILLPDAAARDRLAVGLAAAGIDTRPFFHPVSALPPYRDAAAPPRPVAASLSSRGLNLPSGPGLRESEIDEVCASIRRLLGGTRRPVARRAPARPPARRRKGPRR